MVQSKRSLKGKRRVATNQTLGRPQTIHGRLLKGMCVFSAMFGFLPELLSVCVPSVLPHTVSP